MSQSLKFDANHENREELVNFSPHPMLSLTEPSLGGENKSELLVGYWMLDEYASKIGMKQFEAICRKSKRVRLQKLSFSKCDRLSAVFLHRVYDLMVLASTGSDVAKQFIDDFEGFAACNPQILLTDSIFGSKVLQDRAAFNKELLNINFGSGINVPTTSIVDNLIQAKQLKLALTYPAISKPKFAHGTNSRGISSDACHEMTLLFNSDQLSQLLFPCVIQQFIDHNATLYKLYVIGENVHVCLRPSVRNLQPLAQNQPAIRFQTRDVSKKDSNSLLNYCPESASVMCKLLTSLTEAERNEKFERIAELLKRHFKVTLFGVDVIVSTNHQSFHIIDVNTSPDFTVIDEFWSNLQSLLLYAGRCSKIGTPDDLFKQKCTVVSFNRY